MKIITLMEDTGLDDELVSEHGLSLYVELENGKKYIFDTGASAATWDNAAKLGIDPGCASSVFISHGHYDHAGGVMSFAEKYPQIPIYISEAAGNQYYDIYGDDYKFIGIDSRIMNLPQLVTVLHNESLEDVDIIANINEKRLWPEANSCLKCRHDDIYVQDIFNHEICFVVKEGNKQVLISGCAHNGILNILDNYKYRYGKAPDAVISGFHMIVKKGFATRNADIARLTAAELNTCKTIFYTGHCTGSESFDIMKSIMGDKLLRINTGFSFTI